MTGMQTTKIAEKLIYIHPSYNHIGCDNAGNIINIMSNQPVKGTKTKTFIEIVVGGWGLPWTTYKKHVFVFECYSGYILTEGSHIKHIDGNTKNNSLTNLELV